MPNEDNNLNPINPNQNWQNPWWNNQWQDSDNKILWDFDFDFWFDTTNNQTTNDNQWTTKDLDFWNNQLWNTQEKDNQNTNTWTDWELLSWNMSSQPYNGTPETNMANTWTWYTDNSRSWKFLTPDEEEAKKAESGISESWPAYTVQLPENTAKTPEEEKAEEDSFFENIELEEPNNTSTNNETTSNTPDTDNTNLYQENIPSNTTENTLNTEENQITAEATNDNFNENSDTQNNTENTNNDDWLAQEDKKVEESFWTNKEVESTESTDLWWTFSTSDTNNNYIPNENDFSQMTWLLNSAETWPVDLWNISQEQVTNTFESINTNDITTNPVDQNNFESTEASQNNENWNNENNSIGSSEINIENSQSTPFSETNSIQTETVNINVNENQNWKESESPMEISLDSILINNPENNSDQENSEWQWENTTVQNASTSQEAEKATVAETTQKKKKKSWWLRVLIVIPVGLIICALRIVNKMAPDLFPQLKTNDNIVEITPNDDILYPEWFWNSGINNEINDINTPDNTDITTDTNSGDIAEINAWENPEIEENENPTNDENNTLDPNSLAALLEEDTPIESTETQEQTNEDENQNDNQEENTTWDSEFNAFSEIDNMLTNNEDLDRLNDYITQWEYFQQRWTENNNIIISKHWENIITRAQEQISKLENWEEINKSIYDDLDDIISKLLNLINEQS